MPEEQEHEEEEEQPYIDEDLIPGYQCVVCGGYVCKDTVAQKIVGLKVVCIDCNEELRKGTPLEMLRKREYNEQVVFYNNAQIIMAHIRKKYNKNTKIFAELDDEDKKVVQERVDSFLRRETEGKS